VQLKKAYRQRDRHWPVLRLMRMQCRDEPPMTKAMPVVSMQLGSRLRRQLGVLISEGRCRAVTTSFRLPCRRRFLASSSSPSTSHICFSTTQCLATWTIVEIIPFIPDFISSSISLTICFYTLPGSSGSGTWGIAAHQHTSRVSQQEATSSVA
jgi:hypothetical protein